MKSRGRDTDRGMSPRVAGIPLTVLLKSRAGKEDRKQEVLGQRSHDYQTLQKLNKACTERLRCLSYHGLLQGSDRVSGGVGGEG